MDAIKCTCCGGHINTSRMICEYCGTKYKDNKPVDMAPTIKVETFENPIRVLKSQMIIPSEDINHLGQETMSEIAIKQLSRNLADAIAPMMEMETEYDPMLMGQRVTARVRIVEPKYMFYDVEGGANGRIKEGRV